MSSESHPIHPAVVHFPIAFLCLSYLLDIGYGLALHPSTAGFVKSTYNLAPFLGEMARFSHYLNILGLITAVPAVLTGGQQLMGMLKRQDTANKIQKSQNKAATVQKMHPKLKVAFLHAALNDLAVGGSAYNWWTRRDTAAFAPDNVNILLSAGLLVGILLSAYLGGVLVYDYGVGVSKTGEGKAMKAIGKAE